MWIFRYTYCLFKGHSYIDITSPKQSYRYCLHCGKIVEPESIFKKYAKQTVNAN